MNDKSRRHFLRNCWLTGRGVAAVAAFADAPMQAQRSVQESKSALSLSRQLARWVVSLRYEDLPAAVVDRAKGVTIQALA